MGKRGRATPSPAGGKGPTPSPQMGRLMMAPPPAPRSASAARSDDSRPSPGFDLLGEALMLNRETSGQSMGALRRPAAGAGPSAAAAPRGRPATRSTRCPPTGR